MSIRRVGGFIEEALTRSVIGAFYEVYGELGFGFLESVYLATLERELRARGHSVAREYSVRVLYKGEEIAWQRLDLVVDGKSSSKSRHRRFYPRSLERQLYKYLKATRMEVGLILHCGYKPFVKRIYSGRTNNHPAHPNHPERPL